MQRSVIVVQPYLAEYRRAFFDGVAERLAADGTNFELVVGRPLGRQAARGDQANLPEYARAVPTWRISIADRSVRWKRVPLRGADLVISELGSGVAENYPMAVSGRVRFAAFGHGYAAVTPPNRIDGALERWQIRRACHLFAYTESGRDAMVRAGADPGSVTVVRNTIDADALEQHRRTVTEHERAELRRRSGLADDAVVAAFIGGLDGSKRLDELFDVAEAVARRQPRFVLVVAGDGVERSEVERRCAEAPWLRYVGRVDDRGKAILASISSILLNPGRVGLVAVDSFVLGLPIVTTNWALHAPEFDYLEHGRTAIVADDDVASVTEAVVCLLDDRERLDLMSKACRSEWPSHRIDDMIGRFCDGIDRALSVRSTSRP